jgi:type I restriction enzyme S subunit
MKRQRKTLGELCKVVKGKSPISKTTPGVYVLVTTGEEHKTADNFQFDEEAVCIPLISSTGHGHASLKRVHYQTGKFALGNLLAAALVKDKSVLSTKYLARYLTFTKDRLIVPLMTGVANMSISVDRLATVPVEFPSLAEQERIVKQLNDVDDLQELRAQADHRSASLIPALFHGLFGDPMANKNNWELVELIDVISKEKHSITRGPFGGAIKKEIFVSEGFKIYEQKNAIRNDFEIGNYYIDEAKFKELEGFSVLPDDLIVSCSGTIGKVAIVPKEAKPGIINQALLKLRLDKTKALPIFFKHLMETDHIQRLIFGGAAGTAIKNVKPLNQVKKTVFPLPPLPLQEYFAERVTEIRELEAGQVTSHTRLDALFQSMLHRAFNEEL